MHCKPAFVLSMLSVKITRSLVIAQTSATDSTCQCVIKCHLPTLRFLWVLKNMILLSVRMDRRLASQSSLSQFMAQPFLQVMR